MARTGKPVFAFLSLLACSVRAQDVSAAAEVQPAATTVPATDTEANVNLFQAETVQLTPEVVADLETSDNDTLREYAHLFAFEGTGEPASSRIRRAGACKAASGTSSWPIKIVWDIFDLLVGGALSPIIPKASPCYQNSPYNNYNAAKCAAVNTGWSTEAFHYEDPGSMMFPLYEGKTCMPKANPADPGTCTQGGYSAYSVKVTNVAQIQLAVNFARLANLRLVIKNTGHDYNGRSTGKDALSLWMHNLKDIKYVSNYVSQSYSGKAFKVGAGVQVKEMYQAAEQHGVSVVGGICPTVGMTGGYITGGGHSPLMQVFGMAADQVVALEVVTASGRFVTATPEVNSDLYWALLGGGGSTFGIVTSAVIKALPKVTVTTSTWTFAVSDTVSDETFWEAVEFLWNMFPELNEAKTYSYFFISGITGSFTFSMDTFFAPNHTIEQFEALLAPFFNKLDELNIPYSPNTKFWNSFLPAYQATFEPLGQAIGNAGALPGNRIINAENWNDASTRAASFAALKQGARAGLGLSVYNQAPNNPANIINSVNPAFRTEASMIIGISRPTMSDDQLAEAARSLTEDVLGPLREISPNGGTYYNEADINEPNWQQAFWGANYPRLLSIKKKWDPTGVFYSHHGVGSEEWYVKDGVKFGGVPTQNGQLCRV